MSSKYPTFGLSAHAVTKQPTTSTALIKSMTLQLDFPSGPAMLSQGQRPHPQSHRPTVGSSYDLIPDRVLLSADARPCGTIAAAEREVNQIICPPQITGGLQLTPLWASIAATV